MLTLSPTTQTLGESLVSVQLWPPPAMLTHHGVLLRGAMHPRSEANVVTSANDALLGVGQPRSSTSAAEPASRQSPSQADNSAKVPLLLHVGVGSFRSVQSLTLVLGTSPTLCR